MKVVTRKKVKIADLQVNLFVREALNHDHALMLAMLIESGVKLPPISITADNVVVDGRHRIEAYSLNNLDEIMAEVVEVGNEVDLIAGAYLANAGGSLPPSPEDTEHTIALLIERKATNAQIADLLKLPPAMARKFVTSVKGKQARTRLVQAAAAVTEGGKTVAKAAEEHGVDVDKLKNFLGGGRKRRKGREQEVADVQRELTVRYKSVSSKNAALMRRLMEKLEDGDVGADQMRAIIRHIKQLLKKATRTMNDWEARFEAKIGASADDAD